MNGKKMLKEITNFVESMVQKAVISKEDGKKEKSVDDDEFDDKEGVNSKVTNHDQMLAVKKYFAELEAADGGDEEEAPEKELHKSSVKYLTMKPVKDMDEERYHSGKVIISGKLWKQGRRVNIWKERYFTLRETGLSYYSNPAAGDIICESINSPDPVEELVKAKEADNVNGNADGEKKEKKVPRPRGNMFFADIVTPTGHVVEDLNLFKKSLLGGKENAFCVQTEGTIYILSANSPEEKKVWLYNIEGAYSKFVKAQIHKVALMELSWEFGEELAKRDVDGDEQAQEETKGNLVNRLMRNTLERTKSKFVSDNKGVDGVEIKLPPPGPVEESGANKKQSGTSKKKTKRETKRKTLGAKNTKRKEKEKDLKQRLENKFAQSDNLRESFGRLTKLDRRRISAARVGNIKAEALQGLADTFEAKVVERQKLLVQARVFASWQTFVTYRKVLKSTAE
eukprot:CAMPEP_0204872504 /NCGR_PEP_ID=MMETSP1348-20121228/38355_1 /ASSEMBLY_ACC=CAM_ASM_000700 /TAXON_ID=215587 /ORGANISM="Aplanochytrium stocchinoi, Strain GSBS06" /LENGTH=453 /DNA_ID=CAMNT_0052027397 /DNA_START=81 /DNA_END=1442 /DNA_ORIENTATION=-